MSRAPREIQFAEIERTFKVAGYWRGEMWISAVQKFDRGTYSIRVSRGGRHDYFDLDADGTITTAPRGYAKDFKPGRVLDIEAAVLRFAQPDVPADGPGLIEGDTAAEQYDNAAARYDADEAVFVVDHGPVKPPYGTPEREAYDRERGGTS